MIQTYTPTHYSIVTAAAQDYEAFYEEEIRYRQIMGYPPVENLLAVLVSCEDEVLLETGCKYLKEFSIRIAPKETAKIIGPASPGIGKINDVYRKVIYIKDENYDTLVRIKNGLEQYIEVNPGYRKMRIQFDFNPMHVFYIFCIKKRAFLFQLSFSVTFTQYSFIIFPPYAQSAD